MAVEEAVEGNHPLASPLPDHMPEEPVEPLAPVQLVTAPTAIIEPPSRPSPPIQATPVGPVPYSVDPMAAIASLPVKKKAKKPRQKKDVSQ